MQTVIDASYAISRFVNERGSTKCICGGCVELC